MDFVNCYEDVSRAGAYATLEFANTYYLAYLDLPTILAEYATGRRALDFGCGTGRSTRFLRKLGFNVAGVDVSEDMLRTARAMDLSGDYRMVPNDNFDELDVGAFDLVLWALPFDNIPGAMKARIFSDLGKLLTPKWSHRQHSFVTVSRRSSALVCKISRQVTIEDTSEVLGVSPATLRRAWLHRAISGESPA